MTKTTTKTFKLLGERNSGTNLLRRLIADERFLPDDTGLTRLETINALALQVGRLFPRAYDNLYDRVTLKRHDEILGWKHAAPQIDQLVARNVTPVVIVKHPEFWMRSFLEKPFHHYTKTSSYYPRSIENILREKINLEDLVMLKYLTYQEALKRCGGVVVQYESLIFHFDEARARLNDLFGACDSMPKEEVRNFLNNEPVDYHKKYSNEELRKTTLYPQGFLTNASELLEFFGYTTDQWKKTLPYML